MKNQESSSIKEKPEDLTPNEARFLIAYLSGMNETDSYLHVDNSVTRPSAGSMGCRMLAKIKAKRDWAALMDDAGLGDLRLLQELGRHLRMKKITFWQGQEIEGDFEDAPIQLRATELLADFLGKRKHALELLGPGGEPLSIKYEIVEPKKEENNAEKTS